MNAVGRVVRAIGAALVVIGIVVGLPVGLWVLGGPALSSAVPPGTPLTAVLLRPDDGSLLLAFLVLVATAAWLVLALSIVVELVAALTRHPGPRIDLPGFRLSRSIAAVLVAAMLGAGSSVAPAVALAAPPPVVASLVVASTSSRTAPVHVVAPRDTLWSIAAATLGDPLRWREIFDLNSDRPQPDGGRLTEAALLTPGWRLELPAGARDVVRVEPGDTLTGLAADHLGDPTRADELFDANARVAQPDGDQLADPDLLHPGWLLSLPIDEPADEPPDEALPSGDTSAPTTPPPSTTPVTTEALPTSAPDPGTAGPTPGPTPSAAPETSEPAPASATSPPTNTAAEDAPATGAISVAALGISSLVIGGALVSLAVRRRRQLRLRPAHHRIAVPDDEPGRLEWSAGRTTVDTGIDRLDLALRGLALIEHRTTVPRLRSVTLTARAAVLSLTEPVPAPLPFRADGGGWVLDDSLDPPGEAAGCCAPFPTLVSVATAGDSTLLIDLEQRDVLRVGGDAVRGTALLRHLAAELATSRMAEDVEVLLVGFADTLPGIDPERLRAMPDLGSALDELELRAQSTRDAIERHDLACVVDGRLRDLAGDSWLPTVLLSLDPPDDDQRDRLVALGPADRSAVSAALLDPAHVDLLIDPDGRLTLPDVDDGLWQAAQLTERAGGHLAALLGTADEPAEPARPAVGDAPWTVGMNEDGSLHIVVDGAVTDDEQPDDEALEAVDVPAPRPVDPEVARRLEIVERQDPNLDDDLAAWHDGATPGVPMIGILGEPTVRGPGIVPKVRPSWFAEVLVYLSLHPGGVSASKAVTDLWPEGQKISPATIRHAFYGARRWAGRGLGGDPAAPFVSDMQTDTTYRLRGHLLDWDLFRRLRKRGDARHHAAHPGAVDDYTAALALIRGPVLSRLRPGGYAWLNNHDQRHDLQIPGYLIDAAHELVDIALADGNTALARRAAEQARAVDVDVVFDRPLTDLMRVAHAEDNRAELELYATVLLDARGFEVPEELAPDSFAVLNELLPAGPRSRT